VIIDPKKPDAGRPSTGPKMAAGISDHGWTAEEIAALLD